MDWTINGLTGGKAQLHGESMEMRELGNTEVSPPAELPAVEPVAVEMLAPRGKSVRKKRKREDTSMERGREREEEDEGGDLGLLRVPESGGVVDDDDEEDDVNWPLPMSPLQQIFKSTEMRDGKVEEVKHETYYHP
jgi:hypothetical protein